MNKTPTAAENRETHWAISLGAYAWILAASWTACVAGSLWWSHREEMRQITEEARKTAEFTLAQDILYRRWAAGEKAGNANGSVTPDPGHRFHPHEVSPPPVPPLGPDRPAFMAPDVYDFPLDKNPVRSHLVSLHPIQDENAPDAWEAQGLRAFEQGIREVSQLEGSERGAHFRLMRPFLMEKACLTCHEVQGYKEGDIRGGISVSAPVAPFWDISRSRQVKIALTLALLWIIGLAGIGVGTVRLQRQFSERKRAEEALRYSQGRLHALVRTIPDLIWLKDPDGVYLSCNTIFERLYGAREADIIGKTDYDFVDRELADSFREHDRKAMAAGRPTSNEEWITFADDGHRVLLETIKTPMVDSRGTLIGVLGIGRDITERKRAEEALLASEARFKTIFDEAPLGIALIDPLTGLVYSVNPMFAEISGRTIEEMAQIDWMSMTHPDDVQKDFDNMALLNSGKISGVQMEKRYLRPDGTPVWINMTVTPIDVADKEHPCHLCMIEDITERQTAQRERATLDQFRLEVSNAFSCQETLPAILNQCAEAMVQNLGAAFARIWTLNREESVLELQASAGLYTHLDGPHARVPVGKLKIGLIASEGKPHLTNQVIGDPRVGDQGWARREGMVSFAGYPLTANGHVLGVVAMFARRPLSEFTLRALAAEAERIAVSIERKQAEETLRQSEQRYRSILKNMEEGYYEVDLEGTLTFANDAFYGILGRTAEEMLGKNYREVMRPEKADRTRDIFNEVFRTGEPAKATDWEMIHKDGSPRAIEASVIPLRIAERRYSGFSGVMRDVTESRRAEEELRAIQARYRTLVENVGEGIGVVDLEETVVFSNPAADNLFGLATGALVGRNLRAFMTPAQFAAIGDQTRQRQLGKTSVYEVEIVLQDGKKRYLLVTAVPQYDGAQKVSGTLAILHDITARKEAAERLRLADLEREKAKGNALLAQLIQGLAHEVRNPLFAINTNVAVLEKKTGAVPGVDESIGFVKEHVGRLDSLMRDLLDLGHRPKAGDRVDCRLRDVAEAAVLAVEAQTPKIYGRVVVVVPESPFTVPTTPDRLKRTLVHLIENALQNSPAGSRVTVRVDQSGGQAFVAVMDEGSGIPEKIRARLFEPFVTTHTGRRGLGLALAEHYVESMGGTIEAANNEPGPGATFTVRLPVGGK